MMENTNEKSPLHGRLEQFGDEHASSSWFSDDSDCVARLGLTATDVPELIRIARQWIESEDKPAEEDSVAVWAPVHAWRALGQLKSVEAVPSFLEMLDPLDEVGDDWFREEFPDVFALIGPAAMGPLRAYLADESHSLSARTATGVALRKLALRHPEVRAEAVEALCAVLSRPPAANEARVKGEDERGDVGKDWSSCETLNGFMVADLLDLKAMESAEVIERAFAADRVDVSIAGNWNDVRKELGVEGLGLVPKELAEQKWIWAKKIVDAFEDGVDSSGGFARLDESAGRLQSARTVGRNEPCPCGSGKKYKKCCGKVTNDGGLIQFGP